MEKTFVKKKQIISIGEYIDRYMVLRKIGEGVFSDVYSL